MQDPTELARKIKAIRARVPDATDEEILSFLDQESNLPSAAPVDRVDQTTVRNPAGQDPLVKYGIPAAKIYATTVGGTGGWLAGEALAKKVAGVAGKKVLGRMGIGAAAGLAGGTAARATGNVASGRNPVEGLLEPANLGIDAALGAVFPAAGAVFGGVKKLAGYSPKLTQAQTLEKVLNSATRRSGHTPEELELALRMGAPKVPQPSSSRAIVQQGQGAVGSYPKGFKPQSHSVVDMDPQLQGLASDAARHSPTAERQLQDFASARANVPDWGVVDDMTTTLGGVSADVNTGTKAMKKAIKAKDNARFTPLWEQYTDPIEDPLIMDQVGAIFETIGGARTGLINSQVLKMRPVRDLLQQVVVGFQKDGTPIVRETVTLRGLHQLKQRLDKIIRAGEKAATGPNGLSGADASALYDMQVARDQLVNMTLDAVPGGVPYKEALAASHAERSIAGSVREGADAAKNKVTAEEVTERVKALQPKELEAYRSGMAGQIKRKASEVGGTETLIKNQSLQQKLKDAAVSPEAAAERSERLPMWQAMKRTNKAQETIQPPRFSLSGEESVGGETVSSLGMARGVGGTLAMDPRMAKTGLWTYIGNKLFRGAIARNREAQQKAWEQLAPWLQMQPGHEAADAYRTLLGEFGKLRRAGTITSARRAGAVTGAIAGAREP